jgi:hypothetical protein
VVADDELKTVRLVGLPVPLHVRTSEHSDELMREFTFLRAQSDDPEAASVPARLLDLVDELSGRYGGFTAGTQAELDTAIAGGLPAVDLEYRVPADVAEACVHLRDSLDAADEFCRQGQHLLTLASPEDVVTYRRWFLEEFVRQVEGADPLPWPAVSA